MVVGSACGSDVTGTDAPSLVEVPEVSAEEEGSGPAVEVPEVSTQEGVRSGNGGCDLDAALQGVYPGVSDGTPREIMIVSGYRTTTATGAVTSTIDPVFTVEVDDEWRNVSFLRPGNYVLEILSSEGRTLRAITFDATDHSVASGEQNTDLDTREAWLVTVENPPDFASYRICRAAETLVEVFASANAPVVEVVSPVEGQVFDSDVVETSWVASDADEDDLSFLVRYSVDGGTTYRHIASRTTTRLSTDRHNLVGSDQARFQVVVSDGVHSAIAESPIFVVAESAPEVYIESPLDGEVLSGDDPIYLEAWANDTVDGILDSIWDRNVFQWYSDVSGDLTAYIDDGYGGAFVVVGLEPGIHNLTAKATNSSGVTGTATVTVTIQ